MHIGVQRWPRMRFACHLLIKRLSAAATGATWAEPVPESFRVHFQVRPQALGLPGSTIHGFLRKASRSLITTHYILDCVCRLHHMHCVTAGPPSKASLH